MRSNIQVDKVSAIKREILLEDLNCAHCASKIEHEVIGLENVRNAHLDFVSKKLTIELKNQDLQNQLMTNLVKIVHKLEPDVKLIDLNIDNQEKKESQSSKKDQKVKLIRIGAGLSIFLIALISSFSFAFTLILYILAYVLVGVDILIKSAKNISRGQVFDENFLMSIATIGALAIGQYSEAIAVMLFYQIGMYFQNRAVNRSRKSITALMNIKPEYANLKTKNGTIKLRPEKIEINNLIIVKPGEKVPLDGIVTEGTSMVETSALTGESVPRRISKGQEILSGFINLNGLLTVSVTKEFKDSTVSKILDLVENASSRKSPTENFITKFARYYTPAVIFIAALLAIIPPLVITGAVFSDWIYRALVFLVISCPCALVISIPLSFFGGIGTASRHGILIKGSNYLEALNNVEIIVFDKTGTLTRGVFEVTEINPTNDFNKEELLEYAALAESYSNHPIAQSIHNAYAKEIPKNLIIDYDEIPGLGLIVKTQSKEILAGNARLMQRGNIDFDFIKTSSTIVHLAIDKKYAGHITISDQIKDDSKTTLQKLKKMGIKKTVMLTGDSESVGEKVGKELGIDEVYAELLPQHKIDRLELLENQTSPKGKLVFVGDGINDAPSIVRADIGIAMGGLGSDAAIEAADIVLMTDEPKKIVEALKIARKTRGIVWQNIILALGVKLIVLILGAAGMASLWEAVFADVGVTVLAVLNSIRIINTGKIK